jgi:hypothetical protein
VIVELRCAALPFIGAVADHYWFVATDQTGRSERWEVWQSPNAGGVSFGHLHRDLKHPDEGVGGGPTRVIARWDGEAAARLAATLKKCCDDYPHKDRYFPWPGPNSNTFVAWVLRQAGIDFDLHWKALGKDYA